MTERTRSAGTKTRHQVLRRRANQSAAEAGEANFVARHLGDELMSRLDLTPLRPDWILDAGAATGADSRRLARRYRGSRIVAVDIADRRLAIARRAHTRFSRRQEVAADACRLPFAADRFDMVFANLLLPWLADPRPALAEFARVLRPEGLFVFSSFGPDSFGELRAAWEKVDRGAHVASFPDMHDLGDAMMRAGFADPVLDADRLVVTYADTAALLLDLKRSGARNTLPDRARGLTTPRSLDRLAAAYEASRCDRVLPMSLELVYGHAWGARVRRHKGDKGLIRISPDKIGRRN